MEQKTKKRNKVAERNVELNYRQKKLQKKIGRNYFHCALHKKTIEHNIRSYFYKRENGRKSN